MVYWQLIAGNFFYGRDIRVNGVEIDEQIKNVKRHKMAMSTRISTEP